MKLNRRAEDKANNGDLIKSLMSNGNSTKYLVAKMYIEFKEHFTRVNGKLSFHDKFVWAFIGILIAGFIGGIIAVIINFIMSLGG